MTVSQTKHDLKKFRRVEVSVTTHFHSVSDGRLLHTVQQVFPIPLDKKLKTMLTWAVNDFGISYTTAMELDLAEWFKSLATDETVQQDMRKSFPHLPEFHVAFCLGKQLAWIQSPN